MIFHPKYGLVYCENEGLLKIVGVEEYEQKRK